MSFLPASSILYTNLVAASIFLPWHSCSLPFQVSVFLPYALIVSLSGSSLYFSPFPHLFFFLFFSQITTAGASIGQSDDNTVAIPSDHMLAPLNHAIVKYEQTRQVGDSNGDHNHNHNNTGVCGGSEEALLSKDETTPTADGRTNREGRSGRGKGAGGEGVETNNSSAEGAGGFYFSDGGQETDFAAAFRIRVGEGNRDWPLTQV